MLEKINFLGAIVAVAFFVSAILVFIFWLLANSSIGMGLATSNFCWQSLWYFAPESTAIGTTGLILYPQIGFVLAWLIVEALLDYMLQIDCRNVRWMVSAT